MLSIGLNGPLVSWENFQWVGSIDLVWDCLNYNVEIIDYWTIFLWILKEIKPKKLYQNLVAFLALLESPWWVRFNNFFFTIFKAKVWKILIFEWFFCWKFKKIEKIGFGRKTQLNPWCVHIVKFINFQFWKCEK
jgi:hypothetical protein